MFLKSLVRLAFHQPVVSVGPDVSVFVFMLPFCDLDTIIVGPDCLLMYLQRETLCTPLHEDTDTPNVEGLHLGQYLFYFDQIV